MHEERDVDRVVRLMPNYRKRRFFYELDKIFKLPKQSKHFRSNPSVEYIGNSSQCVQEWLSQDNCQIIPDSATTSQQLPFKSMKYNEKTIPISQSIVSPVVETQIINDKVTGEARASDKTVDEVAMNTFKIPAENSNKSTTIEENVSTSLTASPTDLPSMNDSIPDTSIEESMLVPTISFHAEESRDGLECSNLQLSDSFSAFPSVSATPQNGDAKTPPTQQSLDPYICLSSSATTLLQYSPPTSTATTTLPSDYLDADCFAEIIPCWLLDTSPCPLHDSHLQFPQLLFYIQVLDFVLSSSTPLYPAYFRMACIIARRVFVELWHNKQNQVVLDSAHYVDRGNTLPGICASVWRHLHTQWQKYQSCLHYSVSFSNSPKPQVSSTEHLSSLKKMQVYGYDQENFPNAVALASHYLTSLPETTLRPMVQTRHVVSDEDMQQALRGLQSQLKCPLFSVGTFRRGGIFLSVLDVLAITNSSTDELVQLLKRVRVLEIDDIHVTATRLIAPIRFKSKVIILDLKVYMQPQASFALLYFTGPSTYVYSFAHSLSFEKWFDSIVQKHGMNEIHQSITDEASVCRLLQIPYKAPKDRLC